MESTKHSIKDLKMYVCTGYLPWIELTGLEAVLGEWLSEQWECEGQGHYTTIDFINTIHLGHTQFIQKYFCQWIKLSLQ